MNKNQSIPFWGWVIIGFFILVIFKVLAIVLGGLVIIFQACASMSPQQKKEAMERAHLAHNLHTMRHNSKNKDKHK